jgi:hypothetical protein
VRLSTVNAHWAARPRPGLPDAQEWSITLALALIQAPVGRRSVAQLNRRWLGGVERHRRRRDSDDSTGDEADSRDRERQLAALPVEFGEREVGSATRSSAGEALEAMTVEDGLCLRESGRLVPTAASHYGR